MFASRRKSGPLGRVEFDERTAEVCDPTTRAAYQIERTRTRVLTWTVGRW